MAGVLVLTAAAGVPDAAAETVAGRVTRLAPSAIEIVLDAPLPAGFAVPGMDANVVPVDGRRKQLLIADMDSTIISVECIDELADFAGVKAEVAAITERAMRGELDFEAALDARVALVKGLPESALAECYAERVRLNPGARTLVRTMAALGAETALVSGGFTYFTARVATEAGFAHNQANTLLIEDGKLTGQAARPILGRAAKLTALEAMCKERAISVADAIAVGDGANDLDMVRAAGLGVAYHAKPALAAEADARLEHSDLTALLALQGIAASEWVTD
ncbi:phosphoserine phosphatase [Amaricoccus macauensis]|uniref:Phosphoserine phosphatase n=1 Tax=Amaricoccus macauensis TaxID=57001 RepID=A0A840SN63_9RHOB|nr:phosphoserine phosphatase SerB [Amaricoccus macauensis]MBB5222444.1 phosphoserine phosphatase [Amaricoccus macauensis]